MPAFFSPPTAPGRPFALRRDRPYSSLLRHYGGIPTGINVWLLGDGSVTTVEPLPGTDVARIFHGGHIHEVDDAEVALLTAAGYAANIVGNPLDAGLPGGYGSDGYGEGIYGGSLPSTVSSGLPGSSLSWDNDLPGQFGF